MSLPDDQLLPLVDLGDLLQNTSFDQLHSDSEDSFSWYQSKDAENFKRLTGGTDPMSLLSPAVVNGCFATPPLGVANNLPPADFSPAVSWQAPMIGRRAAKRLFDENFEVEAPSSTSQFPKPPYSFSCLITLAMKNSPTGRLQVAEIYDFLREHFPYFRTAQSVWKNSVRHNLSLNKAFRKFVPRPKEHRGRSCCLWGINPAKLERINAELRRIREKSADSLMESLANPADLDLIEQGLKGIPRRHRSCPLPFFAGELLSHDSDGSSTPDGPPYVVACNRQYANSNFYPTIRDQQDMQRVDGSGALHSSQPGFVSSSTSRPALNYSAMGGMPYGALGCRDGLLKVVDMQSAQNYSATQAGLRLQCQSAGQHQILSRMQYLTSSPVRDSYSAPPNIADHSYQSSPSRLRSIDSAAAGVGRSIRPYNDIYLPSYSGGHV